MPTLVLADEQPVYLLGLRQVLAAAPDYRVLATCADGERALATVMSHRPDLLVADLDLPGRSTLSLLAEMRLAQIETRTVVLALRLDEDQLLDLIRLGVRGTLLKTMPAETILKCLHKVQAGGEWLERQSAGRALERLALNGTEPPQPDCPLSPRELTCVSLVSHGLSNREIGARLHLGETTVKAHLHRMFRKLEVRTRGALAAEARERGWI